MDQQQAYRLELQTAMYLCEINGDIEGDEQYQQMIDELDENWEE